MSCSRLSACLLLPGPIKSNVYLETAQCMHMQEFSCRSQLKMYVYSSGGVRSTCMYTSTLNEFMSVIAGPGNNEHVQ